MGKGNFPLYACNRGEVSRLALGRIDVDRLRLSAEEQINWLPMVLGPMTMRPGLKYLGGIEGNLKPVFIPFVFGNTDTAAIELTNGTMRVWVDDAVITRPAVFTSVTNGTFNSAIGWDLDGDNGNTATISGGRLTLAAPARGTIASCGRFVTVPLNSQPRPGHPAIEHAFRIVVDRGPVLFRAGSSRSSDNYISTTDLAEGVHSLAFTPTGQNVYVYFETSDAAQRIVSSITIENAGEMLFSSPDVPWANANLPNIRYAQSGDIVFVACKGVPPYKIERRSTRSWSIVKYLPENGPLKATASEDITLKPSAMYGNATLESERAFFTTDHVGCLFRLFSSGQANQAVLAAADTYTDAIRVTGIGHARGFSFLTSGNWVGLGAKLTLQRSTDDPKLNIGWEDAKITGEVHEAKTNGVHRFLDSDNRQYDNIIVYYRVGFKPDPTTGAGDYRRGAATVRFRDHAGVDDMGTGGGAGVCRVTGFTDSKHVRIEILKPFTSLSPTRDWQEGFWNEADGYPSSVAFHDGRLWWAGGDRIWGSVSDDYTNFDIDKEGDAGPISRSVGFGPIDTINWMLPLSRLILGREGAETSVRSSSLDEPITPTNFSLKDCSTKGSAASGAIKSDTRGIFISKTGKKAYELVVDPQVGDYKAHDLTRLHPDIGGSGGLVRACIQQNPDTTIHFVRADGQVAVLLYDKEDEVEAWWRVDTDGFVEDAFVLPGDEEDHVYYVVRRVINGSTARYLEKFALRSQCSGLPDARLADSHIVDTGGDVTITGLSHLNGETVVAWGWNNAGSTGVDLGDYTVSGGKIITSTAYDNVCVGLPYDATFKSAKLAYAGDQGTAVNQKKRVDHVGLILYDTHYQGLKYGQRSDVLDDLPLVSEGAEVAANTVHDEFDEPMIEVPGEWDTDSRLYLKASSPRPCTVAGVVVGIETHG